jgi:two-component system chemotaxis response regulator CheB
VRKPEDAAFDVVAIAASRGGVEAVQRLLAALPADFPAAIVVLLHISHSPSYLAEICQRSTALKVNWACDGMPLLAGEIIIAPPDAHLLINLHGECQISSLPPVNYVRPSADLLFETASMCFGDRMLAVILSGSGRDGAVGARAVKNAGGRVLVQDRETSVSFEMPRAAIETGAVDFVLPLDEIASAIYALVAVQGAADFFRVSPQFAFRHVHQCRGLNPAFVLREPGA